jgi:branched-chain amino acid transport system permease protein
MNWRDRLTLGQRAMLASPTLITWVVMVGAFLFGIQAFGIGSDYWSSILVIGGIYVLLAIGLNVVVGYAGLLDLGYAGFWAVGAYATAFVTGRAPFAPLELGVWAAVPFAIAAAVISGLFLGLVTLRVRGDYLAIVTLGFGEIVRVIANSWDPVTGGPSGVTSIPHPEFLGLNFGLDPRPYVILIWALIGLVALVVHRMWNSRVGRRWFATKQDEDAAEVIGIPTFRTKLLAFALGASTAGFAGVVYSSYVGYISPDNFLLTVAILVLASVVLGGMGHMGGAMVGALALVLLPEIFRDFDQARFLGFGIVLIVMMIVRPAGILPAQPRRYRLPEASAESRGTQVAASGKPLLEVRDLVRRFGGLTAVNQVAFEVLEGEILSVIGPNGAGKSTLFDLITGVQPPDGGSVVFGGQPLTGLKPHDIARLGVARTFQLIRLFGSVSAAENVMIGADLGGDETVLDAVLRNAKHRAEEDERMALASQTLAFCGIRHLAENPASSLSYGDQRRLEIARALAMRPRLLLLDEPAAGMNPTERQRLMELIESVRHRGVSILLIEHDISLVMTISNRIVVLDHGVVIACGRPAEVVEDPAVIEAYLGTEAA